MAIPSTRDIERMRADVGSWLAKRLGVRDVAVGAVTFPKAGFSNETMFIDASWQDSEGQHKEQMVLRIEPTSHQLFVRPDAMFQAAMMMALARHPGTPVPRVWFTESDPSIVGAPFFVMERSQGHVPPDMPSYHVKGWATELNPQQLGCVHDSGITALASLHSIDWRDGFDFLDQGRAGRAWKAYLDDFDRFYAWSAESRIFDAETLDTGYRYIVENAPTQTAEGVVWGDARIGNMMFSDQQQVVAMFDWETATLGPPGIDLGWWLMFEDFLSGAQGVARLPGTPSRDAVLQRYERISGRSIPDIDYYELLACVVMATINSRLGTLLMRDQGMSKERAGEYARRSIAMVDRLLTTLNGRA